MTSADRTSTASVTSPVAPGSSPGDLFQLLLDGTPRTRAELAQLTGLARSTIAARVEALMESGLISAVGEATSSGGRPPSRFAFDPSARAVLAVDLGAMHAVVAITDLAGRVLLRRRTDLAIASGPTTVLDTVVAEARQLLEVLQLTAGDLAGVGIGLPGPVEHTSGRPANPPIMPGWHGFDVPSYIRRSFDVTVLVDNDVNIMALGEQRMHWPSHDNLLFIKVSTGIGAGIIGNGQLQRGALGAAGDLGHVRVGRGGDVLCRCGNVGCLEALAGAPAIAAGLTGTNAHGSDDLVKLAEAGDVATIAALRQAGRDLGEVLATCVSLLNPSVIVLGGALSSAGDHVLAGAREVVYARSLPLATSQLTIARALSSTDASSDDAGVIGASMMVTQHVLSAAAIEDLLVPRTREPVTP
ncbi:ROK family transcriptional regulator [Lacisediminihabitans sp. G11-30]|uniref:ROK family transcriptional regulator n=2 Tax=Lacisediminihabitans changchengi TaxID=2787634 RepID=A0A934SW49_9MICO|nr:ROK family transcriptional regulator [Lacisediminihabitans changchengi]